MNETLHWCFNYNTYIDALITYIGVSTAFNRSVFSPPPLRESYLLQSYQRIIILEGKVTFCRHKTKSKRSILGGVLSMARDEEGPLPVLRDMSFCYSPLISFYKDDMSSFLLSIYQRPVRIKGTVAIFGLTKLYTKEFIDITNSLLSHWLDSWGRDREQRLFIKDIT
jgi:hypothetical protein